MWVSVILSSIAFNGSVGLSGGAACVSLRPYADPRKLAWNIGSCSASVSVETQFAMESTLAQMGAVMQKKLSEGEHFTFLKNVVPQTPLPGLAIGMLNFGPMGSTTQS
jgi:hypothetical protein